MADEMIDFYNHSIAKDLCKTYTDMWHECKSKRQLIDFCLRLDSVKYMAESRSKGWGLSTKYLNEVFGGYINGNYTAKVYTDEECYRTAELYCDYNDIINTKADYIHIIDSNCTININDWQVLFIYVSGRSYIDINMGKNSIVYAYCYDDTCVIVEDSKEVENSKINVKFSRNE